MKAVFSKDHILKVVSAIRKRNNTYKDVISSVIGSFPYISGDTFKCISDLVYKEGSMHNAPPKDSRGEAKVIYADLDKIESEHARKDYIAFISSFKKTELRLIFHNGDTIPDKFFFEELKRYANKIYSVNIKDEYEGITQIPIGLENYKLAVNGFIAPYKIDIQLDRIIDVYSPFSILTNPQVREGLVKKIQISRHRYSGIQRRDKYLNDLARAKFVLSPVGSGLDCHRTWEAIYMGAVPVVERGTLTRKLIEDLPILEVSEWGDFLSLSSFEFENLYRSFQQKNKKMAFMNYWLKEIYA